MEKLDPREMTPPNAMRPPDKKHLTEHNTDAKTPTKSSFVDCLKHTFVGGLNL
jgi:hypothetical protein